MYGSRLPLWHNGKDKTAGVSANCNEDGVLTLEMLTLSPMNLIELYPFAFKLEVSRKRMYDVIIDGGVWNIRSRNNKPIGFPMSRRPEEDKFRERKGN